MVIIIELIITTTTTTNIIIIIVVVVMKTIEIITTYVNFILKGLVKWAKDANLNMSPLYNIMRYKSFFVNVVFFFWQLENKAKFEYGEEEKK